jgi:hypothetical protein
MCAAAPGPGTRPNTFTWKKRIHSAKGNFFVEEADREGSFAAVAERLSSSKMSSQGKPQIPKEMKTLVVKRENLLQNRNLRTVGRHPPHRVARRVPALTCLFVRGAKAFPTKRQRETTRKQVPHLREIERRQDVIHHCARQKERQLVRRVRNVQRQVLRLLQEKAERLPDLVRRYHFRIDGRDERGGHLLLAAVAVHRQSDELLDEDVVQLQVAQLVQGARDLADVVRGEVLLGKVQRRIAEMFFMGATTW